MITNLFFIYLQAEPKTLYKKPMPPIVAETSVPQALKKSRIAQTQDANGNLPSYLLSRSEFSSSESHIFTTSVKTKLKSTKFKIGDLVGAKIKESVIAYSEQRVPVRALVAEDALLLGEATVEKTSKRIHIQFTRLKTKSELYELQAYAMDMDGTLGLGAKVISSEAKYFTAEVLSSFAQGFVDSSISRDQNALGNYVEKPGVDTQAKKATSLALAKTTDRFAEKLKTNLDYAILDGPTQIQVLITDDPKLIE